MKAYLYYNVSENNKLEKRIDELEVIDIAFKGNDSVTNPVIRFKCSDNVKIANYMWIEDYKRYYFITDKRPCTGGIWEVTGHVDVLMTWRVNIRALSGIVKESANLGNNYLPGNQWASTVKDSTYIKQFPGQLLDEGEFVLITAGG